MAVDVTYQVYTAGRWLPNVNNLNDHAGIYGSPIQGVIANLSEGTIHYRVHTVNGSWLPWVFDREDYAGIYGHNIDGLQMQVIGVSGQQARYRAYVGGRWLSWVTELEDYAGIYGQSIECIQVEIISNDKVVITENGVKIVFIDPGHGGSDPGAIGNDMNESDIVLSITNKITKILVLSGVKVESSRLDDRYVSLGERAKKANEINADVFVSIHANSYKDSTANGTECFTYPSAEEKTKQLSKNISKGISNKLGIVNRGHKEENFAVLRETNMAAVLIETAFISNVQEANMLRLRQDEFAKVIADEILAYLAI